ncbi:MAG: hypothetical protein WC700_07675 [Gemmatimonadaceae bacterium]
MADYIESAPEGGAAAHKRPAAAKHGGAGGQRDWVSAALVAAIVVLVLVIGFLMWRRRYRSRPKCSKYSGGPQQACAGLSAVCSDDASCLNAVAHCMPLIDSASSASAAVGGKSVPLSALDPKAMRACASAVSRVDPAVMAGLATKYGRACVPPEIASALANPAELAMIQGGAAAAATLLPYAVDVAQKLPACKK